MTEQPTTTPADELAAMTRRVIDAVESGYLHADTPQGRRMLRRLEGVAAALEADDGR